MKEHDTDLRLFRPCIALATLVQIQFIERDFNRSKIIRLTTTYLEAIIRESFETISNKEKVCNDALSYDIHASWRDFIRDICVRQ